MVRIIGPSKNSLRRTPASSDLTFPSVISNATLFRTFGISCEHPSKVRNVSLCVFDPSVDSQVGTESNFGFEHFFSSFRADNMLQNVSAEL